MPSAVEYENGMPTMVGNAGIDRPIFKSKRIAGVYPSHVFENHALERFRRP
jgi:hypothetical protein